MQFPTLSVLRQVQQVGYHRVRSYSFLYSTLCVQAGRCLSIAPQARAYIPVHPQFDRSSKTTSWAGRPPYTMKVLKYRVFRIPGRKPHSPLPEVEDKPAVVEVKQIKKKALLIGIQQVREDLADSPGGLRSPDGRMKWLRKQKQNMARHGLKGPHRDVQAIRDLLISECCLYSYHLVSFNVR